MQLRWYADTIERLITSTGESDKPNYRLQFSTDGKTWNEIPAFISIEPTINIFDMTKNTYTNGVENE